MWTVYHDALVCGEILRPKNMSTWKSNRRTGRKGYSSVDCSSSPQAALHIYRAGISHCDKCVGPLEGYLNNPHLNTPSGPSDDCSSTLTYSLGARFPHKRAHHDRRSTSGRRRGPHDVASGDKRCVVARNVI